MNKNTIYEYGELIYENSLSCAIVRFYMYDPISGIELMPFEFIDDADKYGALLSGGYIGFRHKSPLVGEYADLKVYKAVKITK